MNDAFAGFATSLALIVAIGSQNAFVLRQGIMRQHALALVLFCALSDALLIVAGVAGGGALVQEFPEALDVARIGGALFLAAYALFAARRALHPAALLPLDAPGLSLPAALATCFGFTFLNPHVYLDTVVLLGAVATQRGEPGRWWFGLGAASASLCWFAALSFGARLLRPVFARPLAWQVLDGIIAATMASLALVVWFGQGGVPPGV
jgi:L-lysine exporter family protein LysE/ArgO